MSTTERVDVAVIAVGHLARVLWTTRDIGGNIVCTTGAGHSHALITGIDEALTALGQQRRHRLRNVARNLTRHPRWHTTIDIHTNIDLPATNTNCSLDNLTGHAAAAHDLACALGRWATNGWNITVTVDQAAAEHLTDQWSDQIAADNLSNHGDVDRVIATDGSYNHRHNIATWGYAISGAAPDELTTPETIQAGDASRRVNDSYGAELAALRAGTRQAGRYDTGTRILVVSDCRAAVAAARIISAGGTPNSSNAVHDTLLRRLRREINATRGHVHIEFAWVRGHTDNELNRAAHDAAYHRLRHHQRTPNPVAA